MNHSIFGAEGLLEAAGEHLNRAGYAAMPWDRTEARSIAVEALRRAAIALRDGVEIVIHPLGFARIPLSAWTLDRPRVAVHLWTGDWAAAHALDIHDHCYNFVSICISGEIRHSFFEPSNSEKALVCDAFHYRAGCCDEGESASGASQRLKLVEEQTIAVYDTLPLHHNRLHRALPLSDHTVTVQFQSRCIKPVARVFRASGPHAHEKAGIAKPLSREQIALMLERART